MSRLYVSVTFTDPGARPWNGYAVEVRSDPEAGYIAVYDDNEELAVFAYLEDVASLSVTPN